MEQWYYKQNEQKIGPFSEDIFLQMIETKLLSSSAQVCSDTMPNWTVASEVDAIKGSTGMPDFFPTPRNAHPWIRYWARSIDIYMFAIFASIIFMIAFPPAIDLPGPVMNLLLLFLYIFVEPILLATVGTTAGKALLRVRLRKPDGRKLSCGNALMRSFKVTFKGLAIGVPFISLFTMYNAYNHLSSKGITTWDQEERVLVTHKKLGIIYIILLVLAVAVIFGTLLLGIFG